MPAHRDSSHVRRTAGEGGQRFESLCVVGLGFIGLPTAAIFARGGLRVLGVDVQPDLVEQINRGECPLDEPELVPLVADVVQRGLLRAGQCAEPCDAYIVAVPTPCQAGHTPDIGYIRRAAQSIAPALRPGCLVILESTSPVGTTEQLADWLGAMRPDLTFPHLTGEAADVQVAHCPERVLPGRIVYELVHNDRVVGGLTARCARRAAELYRQVVAGDCLETSARTAELCKLTENAFRDVNIAFANELSMICDRLGINVADVIALANRHPRVNILRPGPGVGGHCLAVDPWFIVHSAPQEARLIRCARQVNDAKARWVVGKVQHLARRWRQPTIACLGLTYKADVADLRESPAVEIVHALAESGTGRIVAVEPHVTQLPAVLQSAGVELCDLQGAVQRADLVVLLVDHREFASVEAHHLGKPLLDTCRHRPTVHTGEPLMLPRAA
jgi:UDP-N-acetyl-D-mannosaminuronic acid dehydrogenase